MADPQIVLSLVKLTCNSTSFGPGADHIWIVAILTDPQNNNRVIGTVVKSVGAMDNDTTPKTALKLIDLLPAPAIDGLRCIFAIVKVGPLGSLNPARVSGAQATKDYLNSLVPGQAPTVPTSPSPTWMEDLINGVLGLVWKLKGSWGSTVMLGSDDRVIRTPPINGLHPMAAAGDPPTPPYYEFFCTNYDSNYDVQYTVFADNY